MYMMCYHVYDVKGSLADTYESLSEVPGIPFKKWTYDKVCVMTFCELVYACKLVKARELQFLGKGRGGGGAGAFKATIHYASACSNR